MMSKLELSVRRFGPGLMTGLVALVILTGGMTAPLLAEDVDSLSRKGPGEGSGETRTYALGETRFMSTVFLPSPFITTDFRNSIGLGKAFDIKTPVLTIDDEVVLGLEGDILYAVLDARYQYSLQEWLAVWGRFLVNTRLGNEVQSVLAQGVSVHHGFEVGWLFRLWNSERQLVSTAISLDNAGTTLFDIYGFVSDAIDSGRITEDNDLVSSAPTLTSTIDLRYALAATDLIGIQALVQGSYGESVRREESNAWAYRLGLGVHLDLEGRTDMPLGFIAAYRTGTIPDSGDDIIDRTQSFLFNVSYTGRRDLGLGIDVEHQRLPLRGFDDPVSFTSAVINMQYFF